MVDFSLLKIHHSPLDILEIELFLVESFGWYALFNHPYVQLDQQLAIRVVNVGLGSVEIGFELYDGPWDSYGLESLDLFHLGHVTVCYPILPVVFPPCRKVGGNYPPS